MKHISECPCCGHIKKSKHAIYIGDLLKKFIGVDKKVSVMQVAEHLGVSRQVVYLWLKNQSSPSTENFKSLIRYIGIRTSEVEDFLADQVAYDSARVQEQA